MMGVKNVKSMRNAGSIGRARSRARSPVGNYSRPFSRFLAPQSPKYSETLRNLPKYAEMRPESVGGRVRAQIIITSFCRRPFRMTR